MTDSAPLNPRLYNLLKRKFKYVKISSAREKFIPGKICFNPVKDRDEMEPIQPGEYYQVCCPYCNDTKFRLYVNHMWGKKVDSFSLMHMAICFNETHCMSQRGRAYDFMEELTENEAFLEEAPIRLGIEVSVESVVAEWPGPCTRVDKLPREHKAYQYLVGRGFDPILIGKFYNVHYCHDSFRWLARERLVIPIYVNKKMVGWQARPPEELKWKNPNTPPKYYTMPGTPRRMVIYNIGNASKYETGVIMEGPTDVWALGPMGVCTLGATMTRQQQNTFRVMFKRHSAVLLFDPEEYQKDSVQRLIANFDGQFARGFAAVKLPMGTDPGRFTGVEGRTFLRDYIAEEALKQGVPISWKRRSK